MPKVTVIGGAGLLGYGVCQALDNLCDLTVLVRSPQAAVKLSESLVREHKILFNVDVTNFSSVANLEETIGNPNDVDMVINCSGVIHHDDSGRMYPPHLYLSTNIGFPILLSSVYGPKLIHPSTDCVFDGTAAPYLESSPYAPSYGYYGYSKKCAEIISDKSMVLRTCLIGEELMTKRHLLEWFKHSEGTVNGFTNWWCTPITSMEFGRVCLRMLEKGILSPGIMNLETERVSKYTILKTYNEKKNLNKALLPVEAEHAVDKSLISLYSSITKALEIPSFEKMIEDLVSYKGKKDDLNSNPDTE